MRITWGQTLAMASIAYRVISKFCFKPVPHLLDQFWNKIGSNEPAYMDPRPVRWLGPLDAEKAANLVGVIQELYRSLLLGYKGKRGYVLKCRDPNVKTVVAIMVPGFPLTPLLHEPMAWQILPGTLRFSNVYFASEPDAWFGDTSSPCWMQRMLMHELLHHLKGVWGIIDQIVPIEKVAPDSFGGPGDQGPCTPTLEGSKVAEICYGGRCATYLAKHDHWMAMKNTDNYSFLFRNIALFWARWYQMVGDTGPAGLPLPPGEKTTCDSDCDPVNWWTL